MDNTSFLFCFLFFNNMEQLLNSETEVGLWVSSIPEEIYKYHACGGKMNKTHFPTFLIYTIPASGTGTCLQDPILQLEAGGRKGSRAGTIRSWKLPRPYKFMTVTFPLCHQSSENTFENSVSASCRIETH